ncbi:alpha/beta fold hydrolase [Cupriavidus consociatus]|uniref:alpha/beta fold hydrolase n=1 Tax=Cupriavidus consociatus TaxID=2821357 RepID=UPI001AE11373|nr:MULTISPECIES: alpha/beta hydrolase [unclassified Cupriavidus]MBP0624099.1 alpha/beta hydrolase [Cupriavidus sp. LEh25]MDK2660809.1 alpha/beta hydrolase [Cupriavidus sp. LEh21]
MTDLERQSQRRSEDPDADSGVDSPGTPLDKAIRRLTETLNEVRRRRADYFASVPLALPADDAGEIRHVDTMAFAAFPTGAARTLPPGDHVVHGTPVCSWRALIAAVADAAGIPVRDIGTTDAVSELMLQDLRHLDAEQRGTHATEAATLGEIRLPQDSALDWRARVNALVAASEAVLARGDVPSFESLPGLQRCTTADGSAYYRCGNGGDGRSGSALLLVNAFGMTLDVWHDLVRHVSAYMTILVPADDDGPGMPSGVPQTYYATPDAHTIFLHRFGAILRAEGRVSCHVASWCGGAKLALELAHARPEAIASLALLAPSFAGARSDAGADSSFEVSLNTMCQLVARMPQAAQSMAKSMVSLLQRNDAASPEPDGAAIFERMDAATQHWLHAPFLSPENMVAYSRQLLNFRTHGLDHLPAGGLEMPLMLVTGERDTMTCASKARDICGRLREPLHFEMRQASHYFIHQNSELVAALLLAFVRDGTGTAPPHPRLATLPAQRAGALVLGEI